MRRSIALVTCAASMFFLASCTKSDVPYNDSNYDQNYNPSSNATITYSEWIPASEMTWTDTTIDSELYIHSTWLAPELTETVLQNAVLIVYAKTSADNTESALPHLIYAGNSTNFDVYTPAHELGAFKLFHTKWANGVNEAPAVNGDVSFRYVIIQTAPAPDVLIDNTTMTIAYKLEQLPSLSYMEIVNMFNFPR